MIKQKIILPILIFSLVVPMKNVLAESATSTSATTTTSSVLNATTTTQSIITVPAIIQEINNAKTELSSVKLNYDIRPVYKKNKKGKSVVSTYQLNAKDIALAILDPSDGKVKITAGIQIGKTMKFADPNFDITLNKFNGVNSSFTVNKPAGGTVLALKYLITGPETGSQKAITSAMSESVYVPYSPALSSPDVIAYGQAYLEGIIAKVTTDLRYIPSHAIPGKQIVEAIPPALIKSLIYAEHSDSTEVLNGNAQDALDKLNILFATNQGDAYKYSVSTASARGIAQFIPSTYQSLVARHPEAGLNPDFVSGMADHENAIKAMYMLIDDYAGDVRVKASQGFVEGRVFDYGAASYNGGTTRVAKAVNAFGDNWNTDRSGQINALQAQISNEKSQIKNLKAKLKKTSDKKTKASLQIQLTNLTGQQSTDNDQLTTMQSGTLRNETINYLKKIYKVIASLNTGQVS